MDVENTHPFCLPFSLCHDAPSSNMTSINDTATTNNNNDTNMINLSNNKEPNRSETSSSPDEIFTHLNTNSLTSRSILNDDSLIESSDIMADDSILFYSIHSDTDIGTESTDDIGFHEEEDLSDICKSNDDDWYSTNYSLFSPSPIQHQPFRERKSTSRTAHHLSGHSYHHHHQVFHHVVDPLDIKSSPTLAQLNLNASDDPNESIWDTSSTTTATKSASTSTSVTSASSTDLLTNCTSINRVINNNNSSNINNNHHLNCAHSNLTICNHHSNQVNNHNTITPYTTNLSNSHLLSQCHHYHHNHHNDQVNHRLNNPNDLQGTCLAVAPFFRGHSHHSSCCQNYLSAQHNANTSSSSGCNRNLTSGCNQNKQQSASVDTLHGRQDSTNIPDRRPNYQLHHQDTQVKQSGQQRCASPALVTSSSSPLSSLPAPSNGHDDRTQDNKLKENIEYLTALLCNDGNKMDSSSQIVWNQQHQQQSTISSTMIRSYATLAQSLSTGPRLLERQQTISDLSDPNQHVQQSINISNQQQLQCSHSLANSDTHSQTQPMRHSSKIFGNSPTPMMNQIGNPAIIRSYSDQWFKPTVESSVSAADSTAENQSTLNCNVMSNNPTCHQFISHVSEDAKTRDCQQAPKLPDLRMLSSLLSSNKCSTPSCRCLGGAMGSQVGGCLMNQTTGFAEIHQQILSSPQQHIQVLSNQPNTIPQLDAQSNHQESIPPNGRPITLTPIATSGVIVQQRPPLQQQPSKLKAPLFAQPASPSASSTASSGGNMDSSSTSSSSFSTSTPASKRQKTNSGQRANVKDGSSSSRSARPNSMSTECSLSSHDEGFSSQVDNDDVPSNRDSDDDDDDDEVDSDDESFYGDYTNSDLIGASISDNAECKWTLNMGRTRRNGQKRFFWQYNVQSKGPKGARICSSEGTNDDPFVLPEASDPVFSNDCQIEGVKHSGKARRGDGNDLTPNPKKLLMIGLELKKLGKIINDLVPVTDLPLNARNKTRKEKNKLASRACRLKKKAQHEANKIKLYGLQREHQQVVMAIFDLRKFLRERLQANLDNGATNSYVETPKNDISSQVEEIVERCLTKVAGQTSDYVNSVLEKVVSGCIDGGLQT